MSGEKTIRYWYYLMVEQRAAKVHTLEQAIDKNIPLQVIDELSMQMVSEERDAVSRCMYLAIEMFKKVYAG